MSEPSANLNESEVRANESSDQQTQINKKRLNSKKQNKNAKAIAGTQNLKEDLPSQPNQNLPANHRQIKQSQYFSRYYPAHYYFQRYPLGSNYYFNRGAPRQDQTNPRRRREEKMLDSQALKNNSREFLIEVFENKRGKFIRLREQTGNFSRSKLNLSFSVASELKDKLLEFIKFISTLEPLEDDKTAEKIDSKSPNYVLEKRLKSEYIVRDNRRYYLYLKEASASRFLRITMNSGGRTSLLLPAEVLQDFCHHLTALLEKHATSEDLTAPQVSAMQGAKSALLISQSLQVTKSSHIFFDVTEDRLGGNHLVLSDVRPSFRSTISVPCHAWRELRDILNEYLEKLDLVEAISRESEVEEEESSNNLETPPSSNSPAKSTTSAGKPAVNAKSVTEDRDLLQKTAIVVEE